MKIEILKKLKGNQDEKNSVECSFMTSKEGIFLLSGSWVVFWSFYDFFSIKTNFHKKRFLHRSKSISINTPFVEKGYIEKTLFTSTFAWNWKIEIKIFIQIFFSVWQQYMHFFARLGKILYRCLCKKLSKTISAFHVKLQA